jgi:hypothetical protein
MNGRFAPEAVVPSSLIPETSGTNSLLAERNIPIPKT